MPYHSIDDLQGASRKKSCTRVWNQMRPWGKERGYVPRGRTKSDYEFPVFFGVGVSGVSYASCMAMISGWNWAFSRKQTDQCHHSYGSIDTLVDNYQPSVPIILTDDFVFTGSTMQNLWCVIPDNRKDSVVGICLPGVSEKMNSVMKTLGNTSEFKWVKGLHVWMPFGVYTL